MRNTADIRNVSSSASLRVFGTDLDFAAISRAIGVGPTDSRRAGTLLPSGHPQPRDLWVLKSPLPRAHLLEEHLLWLKQVIGQHCDRVHSLKQTVDVRSFCGVIAEGDSCSFRLSPEALRFFTDLDLDLELSLIFLSSEPEQIPPLVIDTKSRTDAYRTESQVSLRIAGNNLDVKGISRTLDCELSQVHHSGDRDTSGLAYSSDLWSLVVPLPRTDDLDAHLKWLTSMLAQHADFVRSIKDKADLVVHCHFGTESDTGGIGISAGALRVCTELHIPLEFTSVLI